MCVCVLLLACSFVASVLGFESSVSSVSFYLLAHPSVVSDYICGSSVCCLILTFDSDAVWVFGSCVSCVSFGSSVLCQCWVLPHA